MDDGLHRWSQLVRKPGCVLVHGWHPVQVPALAGQPAGELGRPGIRLLVTPVSGAAGVNAIELTSTAAIAMLEGFLASGIAIGKRLSWQSRGAGVHRRDTIQIN